MYGEQYKESLTTLHCSNISLLGQNQQSGWFLCNHLGYYFYARISPQITQTPLHIS